MYCLKCFLPFIVFSLSSCSGCQNDNIQATHPKSPVIKTPFTITSNAFKEGELIPEIYTCDSANISPELHWNNPFGKACSFALIMDDPDAPTRTWVHWLIYNIPAHDTMLAAHIPRDSVLSNGIKQGFTSFKTTGYGGPCPPNGVHRYFFKLYAIDSAGTPYMMSLRAGLTKSQLLNAMKGHILSEADLMGKYSRKH